MLYMFFFLLSVRYYFTWLEYSLYVNFLIPYNYEILTIGGGFKYAHLHFTLFAIFIILTVQKLNNE